MGSFAPTLAQAVCRHGALRIQGWPPCQAMQRRQRKVTGTRHEFDAPACASLYWRRSGFASRPPGFPVAWSASCCCTDPPRCRQARTGAVRESPGGRRLPYRFRATQGIQCSPCVASRPSPLPSPCCRHHAAALRTGMTVRTGISQRPAARNGTAPATVGMEPASAESAHHPVCTSVTPLNCPDSAAPPPADWPSLRELSARFGKAKSGAEVPVRRPARAEGTSQALATVS